MVVAIFRNHLIHIKEFCHPILIPGDLKPQIIRLKPSAVLLIGVDQFNISTNEGNVTTHAGCDFCVVRIACLAEIRTHSLILPSLFTNCLFDNSSKFYWHATNMHVLSAIFDLNEVHNGVQIFETTSRVGNARIEI